MKYWKEIDLLDCVIEMPSKDLPPKDRLNRLQQLRDLLAIEIAAGNQVSVEFDSWEAYCYTSR